MTEAMIRKKAGIASVKDMPLLQDGPPPGGFAPVRFARRFPSKGPSAMAIFLATFGVFSWGMYQKFLSFGEEKENILQEITAVTFRGPSETHLDSLVGQALFGDGAAAMIVGSDPVVGVEWPLFQLVSSAQTILPDSHGASDGHLHEVVLTFHLLKDGPSLISENIEKSLREAFDPLGISDWNLIFWIVHPGGPAILDQVEMKLALKTEKLRSTMNVLSKYGNMSSACVLFILDEMRKASIKEGLSSTGKGFDWGCYSDSDRFSQSKRWFCSVPIN